MHLARGATTETWTLGGPSAASRRYEEHREREGALIPPDAADKRQDELAIEQ